MYLSLSIYIYTYIYIYREREREREMLTFMRLVQSQEMGDKNKAEDL